MVAWRLFSSFLLAQRSVSGKVYSGDSAVAGASVQVKGTQTTTQTDADGNFIINAPGNATLVITSAGFGSQEIKVANRSSLNIRLQSASLQLDDVIVVGYGTQRKVNLTGSVSSVSGSELTRHPVTNVENLLQGKIAGLQVVQSSGVPGADGANLRIRGLGTFISAGSSPLVLVNGVQGTLNGLNPQDIESISVLKDAASASIYGARAANGVILVTTKKAGAAL